jgi:hypothetical protein
MIDAEISKKMEYHRDFHYVIGAYLLRGMFAYPLVFLFVFFFFCFVLFCFFIFSFCFVFLSFCLFICLFVCFFDCFFFLFVYLFVCLFVCFSLSVCSCACVLLACADSVDLFVSDEDYLDFKFPVDKGRVVYFHSCLVRARCPKLVTLRDSQLSAAEDKV